MSTPLYAALSSVEDFRYHCSLVLRMCYAMCKPVSCHRCRVVNPCTVSSFSMKLWLGCSHVVSSTSGALEGPE